MRNMISLGILSQSYKGFYYLLSERFTFWE